MIQNAFLRQVLQAGPPLGCGMCLRPEYYSGRGATTSDLSETRLECIYRAIKKHVSEVAAQAFVQMVADIKVLSATTFLITLEEFEADGFTWRGGPVEDDGIVVSDETTNMGTVMAVLGRGGRDDTNAIRRGFLATHGIKNPSGNYY